jgi:hypothetical protein
MGRRPRAPGESRSGWLALALSVAVHGLLLALVGFLPRDARRTDADLPIDACVVLTDDTTSETVGPPAAVGSGSEPEEVVTPALPDVHVPVGPAAVAAPPAPPAPGQGAETRGGGGVAPEGTAGPPAATFFQAPVEGKRVVYVIDRSASMGLGDGLSAARRELLASLGRLLPSTHFQVIFYNREAEVLRLGGRSDLLPASADNVRAAARRLEHLRAEGGTNHLQALMRALSLEPDVIFFVTDAADLSLDQVRLVTRANGGRAVIHAIELGARDNGGSLELLARSNRGTYRGVLLAGE